MATNDSKFSVRVPGDMAKRVESAAKADQRTTGALLRLLIAEALTARERAAQNR